MPNALLTETALICPESNHNTDGTIACKHANMYHKCRTQTQYIQLMHTYGHSQRQKIYKDIVSLSLIHTVAIEKKKKSLTASNNGIKRQAVVASSQRVWIKR